MSEVKLDKVKNLEPTLAGSDFLSKSDEYRALTKSIKELENMFFGKSKIHDGVLSKGEFSPIQHDLWAKAEKEGKTQGFTDTAYAFGKFFYNDKVITADKDTTVYFGSDFGNSLKPVKLAILSDLDKELAKGQENLSKIIEFIEGAYIFKNDLKEAGTFMMHELSKSSNRSLKEAILDIGSESSGHIETSDTGKAAMGAFALFVQAGENMSGLPGKTRSYAELMKDASASAEYSSSPLTSFKENKNLSYLEEFEKKDIAGFKWAHNVISAARDIVKYFKDSTNDEKSVADFNVEGTLRNIAKFGFASNSLTEFINDQLLLNLLLQDIGLVPKDTTKGRGINDP